MSPYFQRHLRLAAGFMEDAVPGHPGAYPNHPLFAAFLRSLAWCVWLHDNPRPAMEPPMERRFEMVCMGVQDARGARRVHQPQNDALDTGGFAR